MAHIWIGFTCCPLIYRNFIPFFRDCNSCMRDLTCGYCYVDSDSGPQNGTCLRANYDEPFKAVSGRCNDSHLPGDLTWAYDFCPTPFYWMPMVGLVAYLIFFAPGTYQTIFKIFDIFYTLVLSKQYICTFFWLTMVHRFRNGPDAMDD